MWLVKRAWKICVTTVLKAEENVPWERSQREGIVLICAQVKSQLLL